LLQLYRQLRYCRPGLLKDVCRPENVKLRGAAAPVFCFRDTERLLLLANVVAGNSDQLLGRAKADIGFAFSLIKSNT
jgi:hypothetical protein